MPTTEDTRINRARNLRERARRDPRSVDPRDAFSLLEVGDDTVRRDVIEALREMAEVQPVAVGESMARLVAYIDATGQQGEVHILEAAAAVSRTAPELVLPVIATVIDRIDTRAGPMVLEAAAMTVDNVAVRYPGETIDAVPRLAIALDRPEPRVKRAALAAIVQIAGEYPAEVRPLTDRFVALLDDDDPLVVQTALAGLGRILTQFPINNRAVTKTATKLLHAGTAGVRANAAGMLGDYLRHTNITDEETVSALIEAIDDQSRPVRINAITALGRVAVATPEYLDDVDSLLDGLDDPDPRVRERTCFVLGAAGLTIAEAELASTAESDPDSEVVQRAKWALERLP